MKTLQIILGAAGLLVSLQAEAIKRKDVLVCSLSDGSRFVLTAPYEFDPLSILHPHISERTSQGLSRVQFHRKGVKKPIALAGSGTLEEVNNIRIAHTICADYGMVNGVPYASKNQLLPPGARAFVTNEYGKQFYMPDARKERSPAMNQALDELGGGQPWIAASTMVGSRRIVETSLINSQLIVVGAYVTESADGVTWSAPAIVATPRIFELGKDIREQSYIARPTMFNGKPASALEKPVVQ